MPKIALKLKNAQPRARRRTSSRAREHDVGDYSFEGASGAALSARLVCLAGLSAGLIAPARRVELGLLIVAEAGVELLGRRTHRLDGSERSLESGFRLRQPLDRRQAGTLLAFRRLA